MEDDALKAGCYFLPAMKTTGVTWQRQTSRRRRRRRIHSSFQYNSDLTSVTLLIKLSCCTKLVV